MMIALAAVFQTLGIILFFKKSLLLLSNVSPFIIKQVLFLAGLYFFVGFSGIVSFFTRKGINFKDSGKLKGSIVYFSGFILIVIGMPLIGTIV